MFEPKYKEVVFEKAIETDLLAPSGAYIKRDAAAFNPELALFPDDVFGLIQDTQPKLWAELRQQHGDALESTLLNWLTAALGDEHRGALHVLRHGFKFYGKTIQIAQFRPAHNLSPDVAAKYEKNRLTITRQLHYSAAEPQKSLDMVIALNGIPVATLELKNPLTGQNFRHAIHQYKTDRSQKDLIFQFKKRALVHFAVDPDEVYMTTRLAGDSSYFLPFNRGRDNGAGNPPNPNGYATEYLWKEVLERHSFLDILARFIHLATEEKVINGQVAKKEICIFPRYHQLDAVRRLEAAARHEGPGKNYLIQHSAGSGKSNSIAWLAHRLASLHDAQDGKVFDSVIVITDRIVLDRQLQDTIYQFEHKSGVVEKIEKNSTQLAQALKNGVPIVVTTLQKFPFVTEKIGALPEKRYAIIVDEAHSSQSGEAAIKLKEVLAGQALDKTVEQEKNGQDLDDYEEQVIRTMLARGPQPNLSYFAFTATPKYKTLEVFGRPGPDGKPQPFHLYSMRQAIEEKFILDVLKNYTTYKAYYRIIKAIADDPIVEKRKAAAALAQYMKLHPHNIAQKTAIMVEHFRACVRHKIGGRAKAMVATESRLAAVRYKRAFDKYIAEKHYTDVAALVAFSGVVDDDGVQYSEPGMNAETIGKPVTEKELPEIFGGSKYNVLIVAEKYQTGFDQPLLHTMYVDKRLSGVQAVQTLSRLNRTHRGKEETFVLDFVNDTAEILESFKPYYEQTAIAEQADPKHLYAVQAKLDGFHVYFKPEVENFARVFFDPAKQGDKGNAQLYVHLQPAVDRYAQLPEEQQDEFKKLLVTFRNLYAFLAQIMPFSDADLEKLYAFVRLLLNKLPKRATGPNYDFEDDVALQYYRIEKIAEGAIELQPGEGGSVSGPTEVGTGAAKDEKAPLSKLIDHLNEKFGTEFTKADQLFFDQVEEAAVADEKLQQSAQVNSVDNFKFDFQKMLMGLFIGRMEQNEDIVARFMNDGEFQAAVSSALLNSVYNRIKKAASAPV